MAVTYAVTIKKTELTGHRVTQDATFVATGTYTTGGDVISPASVALDVIDLLVPVLDSGVGAQTNGVGVLAWNSSTNKLQIFVQGVAGAANTMVELAAGTLVTGLGFRALVYGV